MVHRPDFLLESTDSLKIAVDMVIVYPCITLLVTIANTAAVGAAARLGADFKCRPYDGLAENLCILNPYGGCTLENLRRGLL